MATFNNSLNTNFNYSGLPQNYSEKMQGRDVRTFLRHGIGRNNSKLLLNDIHFTNLLKIYSDKSNEVYRDYNNITNKNNNVKRKRELASILSTKKSELEILDTNISITILSKLRNDTREFNTPISSGSFGIVYDNRTNGSIKVKFQQISSINSVFNIYLEFLIMNILYNNSALQYKKSIPKPYYIYKSPQYIRMYIRNIENAYTLNDYIHNIIYNRKILITPINRIGLLKKMAPKYIKLFNILLKICNLLQYFQNTFNFVHNDFHHGNILIKKDEDNPNPYIIDFGFASIETNINEQTYYLTNKINQIPFSK